MLQGRKGRGEHISSLQDHYSKNNQWKTKGPKKVEKDQNLVRRKREETYRR